MNIFKKIFKGNNNIQKSWTSNVSLSNWQQDIPKLNFDEQKNFYSGLISSLVDVRAENVAKCQPMMYSAINQSDAIEMDKHPFLDLLKNPNLYDSQFQFFEKISQSLDLFGNAYIYTPLNSFSLPFEMWIVPSEEMQVICDPNNGLIIGYMRKFRQPNGHNLSIKYEVNEIIHLKTSNPYSQFYGLSIIQKCAMQAGIDLAQLQYQYNFFSNDATPRQVLESDESISKEDLERLKSDFSEEFAGARNSGKTPILFGGIKLKSIQTNPKELDFIASRKFTRDELLSIFRVPLSLVGLSENVNKANAIASITTFHHNVIQPVLNRIASQLNKYIANKYNPNYFISFRLPLPEDHERDFSETIEAVKLGAISLNELREFLFYDSKKELEGLFYNPNSLGNSIAEPSGLNNNVNNNQQ